MNTMWQKLKEQSLTIIILAVVFTGVALWMRARFVQQMQESQTAQMTPLRDLKSLTEDNQRSIASTNKLLKDALATHSAEVFNTDEEMQKMNTQRMDALADAIAHKVQPYNPLPKSPAEAEKMQNEQVDKVAVQMAHKIAPILDEMAKDQHLTRDSIDKYNQRISTQVSVVLSEEIARNQQLNNNLQETQAAAADAIKLNHELTALYLDTYKGDGMLTRILMLPAGLVKDASTFSIVNSSDRKKAEQSLVQREGEVEKRLETVLAKAPQPVAKPTQ
jgi:hypothetical protein